MFSGRSVVLGLLLLLITAAACTRSEPEPRPVAAGSVLPSYTAPPDAPGFCTLLAGAVDVGELPDTVGRLAAGSRDVEARLQLSGAISELRDVLDAVRSAGGHAALDEAVDDLLAALRSASSGPLTRTGEEAIRSGLDAVGQAAQPVCEFPV